MSENIIPPPPPPRVDCGRPKLYPGVDPELYLWGRLRWLPESTSPSQNIPPFSTTICDPPRIYPPPLTEYTSPPLQQLYMTLPGPRIYPSLSEYTPPLFNNYNIMRPSQNLPLPPKISPRFQQLLSDPPRIYPSLPDYTLLFYNYMRPSKNLPLPPKIYPPYQQLLYFATLPESTPPSQNLPPFSTTIILCDPPIIYPGSLPEYTPLFNNYNIMGPS